MFDETRMGPDAPITKVTEPYSRLFAIGDIHGCRDELRVIINQLVSVEGISDMDQVVFLGDYVDRGSDSPGVIHDLISFKNKFPRTLFLRGNHEDMMIAYLYGKNFFAHRMNRFGAMFGNMFHHNGGDETHRQYMPNITYEEMNYENANVTLRKAIPKEHRKFLLNTKHIVDTEHAYLVHAGLKNFKYVPLDEQPTGTVLWIREPFLYAQTHFGKTVVHGHTPVDELHWYKRQRDNGGSCDQVNIDTGCAYHGTRRVKSGRLTCLEIVNKRAFSVEKGSEEVVYTDSGKLIVT